MWWCQRARRRSRQGGQGALTRKHRRLTASRRAGPQSYSHEELNFANNHMSVEEALTSEACSLTDPSRGPAVPRLDSRGAGVRVCVDLVCVC